MASEFTFTDAFVMHQGSNYTLRVSVTHKTADGEFLSVTFSAPHRDAMVTVPAAVWRLVVDAVEAQKEF